MAKKKNPNTKKYKLTNGVVYYLYIDENTHIHVIQGNEKLGKSIWNISLLPGDDPLTLKDGTQLTNIAGTCDGCCEGCKGDCYAINSAKQHHNVVIKAWGENTMLAREDMDIFFAELQVAIDRNEIKVLRVHVGGEFFSLEYMLEMIRFILRNPDVEFYFYTKRYEWLEETEDEFGGDLEKAIPNLHPWVSEWHNNYANPRGFAEFHYDDGTDPELKKMFHCPAVDKNGHETGVTCSMCKRCRKGKKGDKIAVYAH